MSKCKHVLIAGMFRCADCGVLISAGKLRDRIAELEAEIARQDKELVDEVAKRILLEADNKTLREIAKEADSFLMRGAKYRAADWSMSEISQLHNEIQALLQPPQETRITVPSGVTRVRNMVTGETISTKEGSSDE